MLNWGPCKIFQGDGQSIFFSIQPTYKQTSWTEHRKLIEECFPVGCVPPACWSYPVVSHVSLGEGGSAQALLDADSSPGCNPPSPPRQTTWRQTLLDADPLVMRPVRHARGQTEWHKPVKTLLCPKHRLRAPTYFKRHKRHCEKSNVGSSCCYVCIVNDIWFQHH